jgi:hypothetical protein
MHCDYPPTLLLTPSPGGHTIITSHPDKHCAAYLLTAYRCQRQHSESLLTVSFNLPTHEGMTCIK